MLSPKTPPALVAPALARPQHAGSLRPLRILCSCGRGTGPGGSQAAWGGRFSPSVKPPGSSGPHHGDPSPLLPVGA